MLRWIKRLLFTLMLTSAFLIALSIFVSFTFYQNRLDAPMPMDTTLTYTVPNGAGLWQVAAELRQQGLMDRLTAYVWVKLASWQQKAHKIKAGEYAIPVGTTPLQLLDILIKGQTVQYSLRIAEGWTFRKMLQVIQNNPHLKQTLTGTDNRSVMAAIGHPEQHPEGRFYPDTYHFPAGMTDVEFLQRAYDLMAHTLKAVWAQRQPNLPLDNAYDALILASIVEKETGKASERAEVAGVFIRRLRKNMLLQTDPTVIYALGERYDGNIRQRDLRVKNPYNTYVYKGLPPTPIALPSRAAIEASVNPAAGNSLFFVGKGDGSHYFSSTVAEHECAVIRYQIKGKSARRYAQWCRKYPDCSACR